MVEAGMDERGFGRYLRGYGKKPHVVEGLVDQVKAFATYLADEGRAGLEAAGERDVRRYARSLSPRDRKARMRGLALYYKFIGNASLAELASGLREQEIAGTRKAFKLREFRGVDSEDLSRLEAAGITTAERMLAVGKTARDRQGLAERTGASAATILELVRLSDLSRLEGVKGVRARLYHDAGLDSVEKLAEWEPDALHEHLVDWVKRTGFDGVAPLPKEIRSTVVGARELPKVVDYEA
jgi:superfamily I DNA/RNA helicase